MFEYVLQHDVHLKNIVSFINNTDLKMFVIWHLFWKKKKTTNRCIDQYVT